MSRKPDVAVKIVQSWDAYRNLSPDDALKMIHGHAMRSAREICDWYWRSIRTKKLTSLWSRSATFAFVGVGSLAPLAAAVSASESQRLLLSQIAVAALALAGLIQVADRVFGWSSGWQRYILTVMSAENATRRFQLAWTGYLLGAKGAPAAADVTALFTLASTLEGDLLKIQADETDKWVSEFNSGLAVLATLVKSQRESSEQMMESARQAKAKADQPGSIEATLRFAGGIRAVEIALDDSPPQRFLGSTWVGMRIAPGHHRLGVAIPGSAQRIERVVDMPPGGIVRCEIPIAE